MRSQNGTFVTFLLLNKKLDGQKMYDMENNIGIFGNLSDTYST